jgi:hypothetical protein
MVVGVCGGGELFTSWQTGSRKSYRKGLGTINPKDLCPVTFQLSYLLKFPKSLKITPPARDQAPNT